jgi:hypothetical protein
MEKQFHIQITVCKPHFYELINIPKPMYCTYGINRTAAEHGRSVLQLPPYRPELDPIKLIWTYVKIWAAGRNVTFRMEDVISSQMGNSVQPTKATGNSDNHFIAMEAQYVTIDALLSASQEIVVHVRNDSSDSSLAMSEDGDDGVDVPGIGLYSAAVVAPLNMDHDRDK